MIAVVSQVSLDNLPHAQDRFAPHGQVFITAGQPYEVLALSIYNGGVFVQVVDDLENPAWLPAGLFDFEDATIPEDWIISVFKEEPKLVLGPDFVAKDLASYERMVELEVGAVTLFWKRLRSRNASAALN